jgi:hypothetical protein
LVEDVCGYAIAIPDGDALSLVNPDSHADGYVISMDGTDGDADGYLIPMVGTHGDVFAKATQLNDLREDSDIVGVL